MTKSDSEWDQRVLCSDGNCIGIIGTDGRCKVCGMIYDGELPCPVADADTVDDNAADLAAEQQPKDENDGVTDDPEVDAGGTDDAWENRTLCVDESCIGVIGPDGRCKECGKPYPGR
jgi:hypothetical protein